MAWSISSKRSWRVRGHTAKYLEISPGDPTRNLLKLAREGLIGGLGRAIRAAKQTNAVAKEAGFRLEGTGELKDVTVKVIPLKGSSSSKERYFLVLFEEAAPRGDRKALDKSRMLTNGGSARLRRELVAT
jgi:two-component system, chemotaxis family, CheB/CheR fusion protein